MKKLIATSLLALSFLLPGKLNPSTDVDTTKKEEVRTLINVATGETIRVRSMDPSYWSWIDPKLSEELDSAAKEIKTGTKAETLYLPPIYKSGSVPREIEVILSEEARRLAEHLGYGEGSWGVVGKNIITTYKKNYNYDPNNDGVMGVDEAVDGSFFCFPFAALMYMLMRNEGFSPHIFEVQKGWFKESGEKDTVVIVLDSQFSGHAIIYLDGEIYDNEAAYPVRMGGDESGRVLAEECDIEGICKPPSFDDPLMRSFGWFPGIFIFAAKPSPWEIERVEEVDSSHPLAFQLRECNNTHSMWVIGGMDAKYYHWGPVTIVDTTKREETWIMVIDNRIETLRVTITSSEETVEKNYAIVFSPEAREMVEKMVKEMSSSQK